MLQTYHRSFSFDLGRRRRVVDIDRADDAGSMLPWKLVNAAAVGGSRAGEGEEEEEEEAEKTAEAEEEEEAEGVEHLDMAREIAVDVRDDDSSLLTRGMRENPSSSSSSAVAMAEPNRHPGVKKKKKKTLSELWREEKRKAASSSAPTPSSQSHHQRATKQRSQELSAESHKSPSQRMSEFLNKLSSTAPPSSSSSSSSYDRELCCIRNLNASGELSTIAADAQALHSSGSSKIRIRDFSGNDLSSLDSRSDQFLGRCKSSTGFALESLRFISKASEVGPNNQWKAVEDRFYRLDSTDGLLARADFGYCIGTKHRNPNPYRYA
jgi:hypothetical protein